MTHINTITIYIVIVNVLQCGRTLTTDITNNMAFIAEIKSCNFVE